jgi:hypothetical protein
MFVILKFLKEEKLPKRLCRGEAGRRAEGAKKHSTLPLTLFWGREGHFNAIILVGATFRQFTL